MFDATFGIAAFLLFGLIGLAYLAFWIWMLVHAITNKGVTDMERLVWVLVLIFVPFIGSIIYFFVGRPKGAGGIG